MSEGLLEEPEVQPLHVGDRVTLRTISREEPCRVEEIGHEGSCLAGRQPLLRSRVEDRGRGSERQHCREHAAEVHYCEQ